MKLRSFRLRIALLSGMLAGFTVAGFAIFSWWLIYKTKVARLDSEIKSQLLQVMIIPPTEINWPVYEKNLPNTLRIGSQTKIALLVIGRENQIIYRSKNWPSTVNNLWPLDGEPIQPRPNDPQTAAPYPPPQQREFQASDMQRTAPYPPPSQNQLQPSDPQRTASPPLQGPYPGLPRTGGATVKMMTQSVPGNAWRLGVLMPPYPRLAFAVNLQGIEVEMSAVQNGFLIGVPVALVVVAVGAWLLSGKALLPVQEVSRAIRRVSAKGLDQRISINSADLEFVELLTVFNEMMARLERSFQQASRFSADAAHELKTPLAILQGELERTLQQADAGSELQQKLSLLLDEVGRLREIVRKLLLLSLADAGKMNLQTTEINLSQILSDLAEDVEIATGELDVQIKIEPNLNVLGDQQLLTQILHNLIGNAIKYNLPQGWLKIEAHSQHKNILVTISNASKQISAKDRAHIFDRFYRGDPSRTHQIEGIGLGLSLAREIARAHRGDLKLNPTPKNQTSFTLKLPTLSIKNPLFPL